MAPNTAPLPDGKGKEGYLGTEERSANCGFCSEVTDWVFLNQALRLNSFLLAGDACLSMGMRSRITAN